MTRVRLWVAGVLAALSIAVVTVAKNKPKTSNAADEHRRAVHALDRLTFGSRPGNADTVSAMGVDKWIELQLDPEKINDSAIEARLEQYRALRMSAREMVTDFPPNPLLKAAMEGKIAIPNDPYRHAIYMAGIARLQNKQAEKREAVQTSAPNGDAMLKPTAESGNADSMNMQ